MVVMGLWRRCPVAHWPTPVRSVEASAPSSSKFRSSGKTRWQKKKEQKGCRQAPPVLPPQCPGTGGDWNWRVLAAWSSACFRPQARGPCFALGRLQGRLASALPSWPAWALSHLASVESRAASAHWCLCPLVPLPTGRGGDVSVACICMVASTSVL